MRSNESIGWIQAARLAHQAGDTKLIVSIRGNKTRARALSSLVWALRACKGMMQSRSGRGPAQSDDPPLPDTPGAQQLDTSLHAVPSICPSATFSLFPFLSLLSLCTLTPPCCLQHPVVSCSRCIGAHSCSPRYPLLELNPKPNADAVL